MSKPLDERYLAWSKLMNKPLDEQYLAWLYDQVASVKLRNPSKTYWNLIRSLFNTEFVWLVPNDDNRVEDGRDLRLEFVEQENIFDPDPNWMFRNCSFLEMLIGLARRLSFEMDDEPAPSDCFWHLLNNLNLSDFNDARFNTAQHQAYVDHILRDVVWRTYRSDGTGGLFPLSRPKKDQRKVELWYQLSSYVLEGHAI